MTDKPYRFADLRTIVPAATPAWLRLIGSYKVTEDDGSLSKEWSDHVVPVLAYATLPYGRGAFLISYNHEEYPFEPTWVTTCAGHVMDIEAMGFNASIHMELSVGVPPIKGTPCGITEEHKYVLWDESPLVIDGCLSQVL